jgi:hypothetical protein
MSLTVTFTPADISDDERVILINMLQAQGVTRVFQGSASALLKTTVTNPALAEADNPATGATSPAEAFGISTPPTETTAALAFSTPMTETVQATQPDGVEIDSEGLPYDARIHSSSREKIKNGTWKIKRGTGETFIIQVKNELRSAMGAPVVAGFTPPVVDAWPFPTPNAAPAMPPPPPIAQAAPAVQSFPDLARIVAGALNVGKITEPRVYEICMQSGLQGFHLLPTRPDLLPTVSANLMAAING